MRIIFIGTGEIGLPTLQALTKMPEHHVLAVVTQPDRPVGRQLKLAASPIKEAAFKLAPENFPAGRKSAAPLPSRSSTISSPT